MHDVILKENLWELKYSCFSIILKIQSFFFLGQDMGAIPIQLADAFGLVIDSRDTMGDRSLLAQTVHTLQQAVQPGKHLYSGWEFSAQDYKEVNK